MIIEYIFILHYVSHPGENLTHHSYKTFPISPNIFCVQHGRSVRNDSFRSFFWLDHGHCTIVQLEIFQLRWGSSIKSSNVCGAGGDMDCECVCVSASAELPKVYLA